MPESRAKSLHVNNGKAVESAWLTHWTGGTHDHLTQFNDHDMKKQMSRVETASDNFGFSEKIKDVDLTMSLKKPNSQSFPFFRIGQGQEETRGGVPTLGPQASHEKLTSAFNVERPTEPVKYHMFFGESGYSCPRPSDQEPYNLNHRSNHRPETLLPKSERMQTNSFLRLNSSPLLTTDPSTSSHRSPVEEQYERMQKHIGMGFFPHQTGSAQNTKLFQNVPHYVHDMEMTRMCAPISSVEGLAGGIHSFSRTTHSLLITKQTDVKVYQESQFFRESRVSTQFKGNCSPPHFGQSKRGLKIQQLDSSDYESQENIEDVKDVQKNESSADTDAMDMGSFKGNHLSGARLSLPNKEIMVESNLPFFPPIATSAEKETRKKRKIELPDMNLEVSALPAASTSSNEKTEPCTSRTQSLDMNTLHLNLDHTSNSNSNEYSNTNLGSEPGNRWIKRLKLNPSNSLAFGTKINKLFTGVSDKRHGKKSESFVGECSGKGESSSVETKPECKDTTLSHFWIQRWSHNQNQKNIPERTETCKPENSKLATDEFEKKQFPSIAAMALMGKAMTGFQQCKFKKKESFVVWNTKTFE